LPPVAAPPVSEPPVPPLPDVPPVPGSSGSFGVNCQKSKLKRVPPPPVKTRKRSCTPSAPSTSQETDSQICQPPVGVTAQVPIKGPPTASRCSSILPPAPSEATLASKVRAPVRKSTCLILIVSPFSI